MNILMVGDSWGVPNYLGANFFHQWKPEHHTEYLLRDLGHNVYNFSGNGLSIIQSLSLVNFSRRHTGVNTKKVTLAEAGIPIGEADHQGRTLFEHTTPGGIPESIPEHIDWTIWFHTEPFRDGFDDPTKTFRENLEMKCHEVYSVARDFFQKANSKIAVIGGQAPIGPMIRDVFYKYITPDFIIEDWRSRLVGENLECYTTMALNGYRFWALEGSDDVEEKERLLDLQEKTITAMEQSSDFPDNAHPGGAAHGNLAQLLHGVFIST